MSKISLTMSKMDIIICMSEGNPGAINVIMQILDSKIDPDIIDPLMYILVLDTFEIYGSHIWMLYKYVCKQDIKMTLGMIRAVQLGIISIRSLNAAINEEEKINCEEIMTAVKEKLPNFGN